MTAATTTHNINAVWPNVKKDSAARKPIHIHLLCASDISPSPTGTSSTSRSPSPYPPSTPSFSSCKSEPESPPPSSWGDSDSESDATPPTTSDAPVEPGSSPNLAGLRATLATLPETRLRELVGRLVNNSLVFQRAFAQELDLPLPTPRDGDAVGKHFTSHGHGRVARQHPEQQPPPPPPSRKGRLRRATLNGCIPQSHGKSNSSISPSKRFKHSHGDASNRGHQRSTSQYTPGLQSLYYHPGRLEEDVYEFPSFLAASSQAARRCQDPNETVDRASHIDPSLPPVVLRTIRMWSCCEGDAGSVGCCPRDDTQVWDGTALDLNRTGSR